MCVWSSITFIATIDAATFMATMDATAMATTDADFNFKVDTVRHSAVLQKLAQLDIPDHIFNWISDYLQDHSHCIIVQQLFIGFANCLCQYNPGVWCRAITVCCGSF